MQPQPLTLRGVGLTVLERLSARVSVPYWATCLIMTVVFGPPFQFLTSLLDTGSLQRAVEVTFQVAFSTTSLSTPETIEQGVFTQIVWGLTMFTALYIPRFMRRRIELSEESLVALAPSGKETLDSAFRGVSRLAPVLVLFVVLGSTSVPYFYSQSGLVTGPALLLYFLASNVAVSFIFSNFIWVYFRSLWGVYRLGKEQLNTVPVEKDAMIGLKPVGTISFSLFLAYTSVVVLVGIDSVVVPDPYTLLAILILEGLGAVLFFLPLNSVHRIMLQNKRAQRAKLASHLEEVRAGGSGSGTDGLLKNIRDLQLIELQRDSISSAPTWPFDTGVLGRFAAVVFSVMAILLGRIITTGLRI